MTRLTTEVHYSPATAASSIHGNGARNPDAALCPFAYVAAAGDLSLAIFEAIHKIRCSVAAHAVISAWLGGLASLV